MNTLAEIEKNGAALHKAQPPCHAGLGFQPYRDARRALALSPLGLPRIRQFLADALSAAGVEDLVTALRGHIRCDSELGKGATFIVEFLA
jgi:hypothetical protein